MVEKEYKPDKIFTLDTFAEIVEAVDDKIRKDHRQLKPRNEKLQNIQGALYEILTRAYELDTYNKEEKSKMIFPCQTVISIEVLSGQEPHRWTDEMLSRLV